MTCPIIRHIDRSTSVRPITMDDITIEGVLLSRYPDCPARDNVLAYCRQRHAGDLTLNTSTMTSLLSDLFYNKISPGKRYIRRCPGLDITVRVADLPLELTDVVIDGKPLWMYPACKERDDVLQYCQTKVADRTNLATSELDTLKEALKNAAAQPQPTPGEQEQPDDKQLEYINVTVCREGQSDIVLEFLKTNRELSIDDITIDGTKLSEFKQTPPRQRLMSYLRENKIIAGQRITNQRKDHLHKLSRTLVNESQVIGIETLRVANMIRNRKLAKHIQSASWSELTRQLAYKCAESQHCQLVMVDTYFPSSHLCSSTGLHLGRKLKLSERSWSCPHCGQTHDRDINAAENIATEALYQYQFHGWDKTPHTGKILIGSPYAAR